MTAARVNMLTRLRAGWYPPPAPPIATVPIRPPLTPEQAGVLRVRVGALNAEFGPTWHVWISTDPAGRVYATRRGSTEHATTAEQMRAVLVRLTAKDHANEDALLASWADKDGAA